jgi:hypothetical protein
LPLPALLDWSLGRLGLGRSTNPRRVLSGLLLGGALGRMIYLHLLEPFRPLVLWQWGLLAVVVLGVEGAARWSR